MDTPVTNNDRKKADSFESRCRRRVLWIQWTPQKANLWVPGQIQVEPSLEIKMGKLRLLYFVHLMTRQESLEKTIRLGKGEGNRKRG